MRIATSQNFDRPMTLMARLSGQADKLQTQIATGVRYTRPSDNAVAFQQLEGLARDKAGDAAWGDNVKLAQGLLAQTDSTLESVQTQIQRAHELATQAANGTLTDANRAQIGSVLDSVIDDLLALANTCDTRGQPLFGGGAADAAYVRGPDGSIAYAGTGEAAAIPIGEGLSVHASVSGERAFAAGDADIFAVLAGLSSALAAGGDVSEAAGDALDGINASLDQLSSARASVGARAFRVDLEAERLAADEIAREERREGIEATDISTTIAELQKTLTVLQATQASFTKLSGLSLFDYLR